MAGLEQLLEWTDNRFGLVSLIFCMFNLFLVRGVSNRLTKCQNVDMCQVMHKHLIDKMDVQSAAIQRQLEEIKHHLQDNSHGR